MWTLATRILALAAICNSQDHGRHGAPNQPKDVRYIKSPNGAGIRYKENRRCETSPGARSYSGYIDVNPDVHMFFWFFESRSDPANDPVTLWQNGGPGADSLIGLFEELGPCYVTNDTKTHLREYSWNKNSNRLALASPMDTRKKGTKITSKLSSPTIPMGSQTMVDSARPTHM